MLCDPEFRRLSGIHPSNQNVFATTRMSKDAYIDGWHALNNITEKLPLKSPKKIKATTNRHRISTLFAALHLSPIDRQLFFKHMGHSPEINENVYQNPMAIKEVISVGKSLIQIDKGKCRLKAYITVYVYG